MIRFRMAINPIPRESLTRRSFAFAEEDRERSGEDGGGSASPLADPKRRKTTHAVTPLLESKTFMKGLEDVGTDQISRKVIGEIKQFRWTRGVEKQRMGKSTGAESERVWRR